MKIIIVGAGGQARVIYECLRDEKSLDTVAFVHHLPVEEERDIRGIPVVGDHSVVSGLKEKGVKGFIVGIGDNKIRADHFKKFKEFGFKPINAIHPTANIAHNVTLGNGIVLGMGANINTNAQMGNNTIINTGAIIEHDNIIEENVHIAPGTLLAGSVTVKKGAFVGIGSIIKEGVCIGENVIIGAGSLVLEDIPDNVVAVGRPSRIIKENQLD
ncbi:hypothetical protein LCGC14_2897660 [marine sediment metagenome]|uniref:PglD N-terminal domain-containing protein n=1 Tax=marine sediment metagenome TaxID=412755 RepID=A0A0F9ALI1_9ZZZZ